MLGRTGRGERRRCLGLRRMYVVDVDGVGRIWPASTARGAPPSFWRLGDDPGSGFPYVQLVLSLAGLAAVGFLVAGAVAAVLPPTTVLAYLVWTGGPFPPR